MCIFIAKQSFIYSFLKVQKSCEHVLLDQSLFKFAQFLGIAKYNVFSRKKY